MQPTPRAMRLASSISAALSVLREGIADAPFTPFAADRTFTIASTDYTTMVILPEIIAGFEREAPRVDLRVIGYDKDDIPELIDRGEIDLALGVFRKPSKNAVQQFLCPEYFVGLGRRGHPLIKSGIITLVDYVAASHALISVRRDATGEIDLALGNLGLTRRVALALPHMLVLPSVLRSSDLLAAVPSRAAKALAGDELQIFSIPLELHSWRIEMLWNPASRLDQASAWLRSKIVSAASSSALTA